MHPQLVLIHTEWNDYEQDQAFDRQGLTQYGILTINHKGEERVFAETAHPNMYGDCGLFEKWHFEFTVIRPLQPELVDGRRDHTDYRIPDHNRLLSVNSEGCWLIVPGFFEPKKRPSFRPPHEVFGPSA